MLRDAIAGTECVLDEPDTVLRDAILAHPTKAEGLNALFAAIPTASR